MKNSTFTMFDVNLMDFFYNPEYENNEEVINAWYIYVLKFLPLVNKKWRESTTPDNFVIAVSMFHFITISDEALMRWFIKIWMTKILKNKEEEDEQNEMNKTTKRGPHDTNVNAKIYTTLHHEITIARRNYTAAVRWNKIFWDEVKKRNSIELGKNNNSKNNKTSNCVSELPLPDLNENQEFLATYVVRAYNEKELDETDADNISTCEATNITPM